MQAGTSGRKVRQGFAGLTQPPPQYCALQESLCLDEPIRFRAPREHFIELRVSLFEVACRGGVHRQLNPDALDRRGCYSKAERLPIESDGLIHPALFGIDRRERDAELARIGPEQLGYIIGKRATLLERKRCMGLREKLRKWVNWCDTGLSACRLSSKDIHIDTAPSSFIAHPG
jgi:hypothetical protein